MNEIQFEMSFYQRVGANIAWWIDKRNKTREEVASRLGVTVQMVGEYLNGNKRISLEKIVVIRDWLGVPLRYLVSEEDLQPEFTVSIKCFCLGKGEHQIIGCDNVLLESPLNDDLRFYKTMTDELILFKECQEFIDDCNKLMFIEYHGELIVSRVTARRQKGGKVLSYGFKKRFEDKDLYYAIDIDNVHFIAYEVSRINRTTKLENIFSH
jgi:transcriptional regulator with XRE-family HTH domain